jgi:GDP-L-fucose synthase
MENINFTDLIKDKQEIRNCHINIGTGKEISIAELASTIQSIIGYNGRIIYNSEKPDGTMRKLTDPSKLHDLGWRHSVELQDGIRRMYKGYV